MATALKLKPVSPSFSLGDHIFGVLRDAILAMDIYNPATDLRLDERALAEELGISRTPIREALVRLEQEEFVEVLPRRGVFVLRKSLHEIAEMITVWAALESMAVRLVVERASDDEIRSLRDLGQKFSSRKASAHIQEYSEANIEFHQRILELSQCAKLKSIADGLFLHMRAVRHHAMPEGNRTEASVVDHMNIIEAIEARDVELASRLVREHTMRLHDHVIETWTEVDEQQNGKAAG